MSESLAVIQSLKAILKERGYTYADVARGLSMSEANIKRMFANGRMGLDRIEAICQLINVELGDLFQHYESTRDKIQQLTVDQEQGLVANPQLLLIAVCVRNQLNFQEMLQYHHISEAELIRCLVKLDRLRVIDLLPNNKIKLRVDQNFSWIPNGPIEQFYRKTIQGEFLSGGFDRDGQKFIFGMLSESSQVIIKKKIKALSHDFMQLHLADRKLPWNQRHNVGMLIAAREWDFSLLAPFVKSPKTK